jgi:thioredoxin 1
MPDGQDEECFMPMNHTYSMSEIDAAEIAALQGPVLLEFGTDWCGWCQAAQPLLEEAFAGHEQVPHIKEEDGKGRALGRAFRVKLWPTLVFLRDGKEVARLVRPDSVKQIREAFAQIDGPHVVQVDRATAESKLPADPDPDDPVSP